MTKKQNKMLRMWVLYALFFGIALFCAGLFFCNVVSSGDSYHLDDLQRQIKNDQPYSLIITDLIRTGNPYQYDTPIPSDGLTLQARTSTFDLLVSSSDASLVEGALPTWVMLLQLLAVLCLAGIFVCLIVLMVSFFRAIRQGSLFRRGGTGWLCAIGLLIILFTLSLDTSTYLERLLAYRLLQGTEWEPLHGFTLHVTRLFCGLIVLFLSELLRIGRSIQEDQDLTI